jgi:hypothetical protein
MGKKLTILLAVMVVSTSPSLSGQGNRKDTSEKANKTAETRMSSLYIIQA